MSNGVLTPAKDGDGYEGRVATLTMVQPIRLRKNPDWKRDNPDSPKYRVVAAVRGEEVAIGVAWERVMDRGPTPGAVMLSMTLDDPSWDGALHISAFPRDGGAFEIVWRRARQPVDGSAFRPDPGRAA